MHYLLFITLLASLLVGCVSSTQNAALRVWHSSNSTIEQRAHAVSELFPVGTSLKSMESVLGTNCGSTRYLGPSINLTSTPPRHMEDLEIWCLVYSFPGGEVQWYGDQPNGFGDRFVRVAASHVWKFPQHNQSPEASAVDAGNSAARSMPQVGGASGR